MPLYAWNEEVAQQIIGTAGSLDYIEANCLRRDYTKALCLWAWVADPNLIPRVRWVTLPGRSSVPGVLERGRRGLQRRCIIHVDITEDMSGPADAPLPMPAKYTWRWGYIDGDRVLRDRTERIDHDSRRDQGRRDDDEEDRDRDGRGRYGSSSRGWRDKLRRSLSRNGRGRDDDKRQQQGRDRDRSSGHRDGGRRRADGEPAPLELAAVREELVVPRSSDMEEVPATGEEASFDRVVVPDASDDDAPAVSRHGRPRSRSVAPAASRRCSRAALTPPSTPDPPSSPSAVCPPSPTTKGLTSPFLLLSRGGEVLSQVQLSADSSGSRSGSVRRALELLAPSSMLDVTPVRPPGFETTPERPTPPFIPSEPGRRTPSLVRAPAPAGPTVLAPLFSVAQQPLLSPPPVRLSNRRKMLAGVVVARTAGLEPGFKLKRASKRLKDRRKAAPIAGAAETALCRGLGIIQDGEVVTEQAMQVFAENFCGEVPDHVLSAMRLLFRIASPEDDAVDDALLGHGGAADLDLEAGEVGTATADV